MEGNFLNPAREKSSKKLGVLSIQKKIEDLKGQIKESEKKYKDRITGVAGYRSADQKNDPIEADILKYEAEIKTLEKEILVFAKREEVKEVRAEIAALEKKHKDRITGVAGYRSADQENDPIEADILKKEAELRALEAEINKVVDGGKTKKTETGSVKTEDVVSKDKKDEDFVYNGASEGFGGNSENISKNEKNLAYGDEEFATITDKDLAENEKGKLKNEKNFAYGDEELAKIEDNDIQKDEKSRLIRLVQEARKNGTIEDAILVPNRELPEKSESLEQEKEAKRSEREEAIARIRQ